MSGNVIVVGASAGGVQALQTIASVLPADFAAPLIVVLHIGRHRSRMPELLSARGALPAVHASDGERVVPGKIYVAPPDHHVLLDGQVLRLNRGPKEHHTRPAVDPLFRSAALSRGPDVVGVVLSGWLDDGTAGLQAIKAAGGVAVAQDPLDAQVPSMPRSALTYVDVDHCMPVDGMAALLAKLIRRPPNAAAAPRPEAAGRVAPRAIDRHEHDLMLHEGNPMENLRAIGKPSALTCPDCHGGLWEIDGSRPLRLRCHTGHAFTIRSLQHAQAESTDATLASAVRALQERQLIVERMAALAHEAGETNEAAGLQVEARLLEEQTDALFRLQLASNANPVE